MKFILGLLAGVAVGVAIFAGLVSLAVGRPLVETRGFAASFQQKQEIAEAVEQPKVIFAGGSSVDLGISAEQAERLLGRPAVNLGLISPLGAEYILDQTRKIAKPGDTVVLALEYHCYDWPGHSGLWLDPMFVQYVAAQDAEYLDSLPWWYRANILARVSTPHLATALLRKAPKGKAVTEEMNSHGDRMDNAPENRPAKAEARTQPIDQLLEGLGESPKGFGALTDFVAWAKDNRVGVIATFPNVGRNSTYQETVLSSVEEQIMDFYNSQRIPVVGSLRGAMFPEEDCFDTPFHLIAPAVERRTRELCESLKPVLPGATPRG
jgi:hypothetical protein